MLQAEIHNIRAALRWSQTAAPDDELGLHLAGTLTWFWHFGNHVNEARGWFEAALHLKMSAKRTVPTAAHAKALWGAGMIAMIQGDYPLAHLWLEESATGWQQLGDQRGLAAARRELSVVALFLGDATSARRHAEESVALYRALAAPWDLALSVHNLGYALDAESDHTSAHPLFEECYALFKALDDTWGLSIALGALGFTAGKRGDYATARGHFEEALTLRRASADKWNVAEGINLLGEVVQRQGDLEQASRLYVECLELDYEVGDKARIALVLHHLGVIAQRKEHYARAARLLAAAAGLREKISGSVFLTLTFGEEYEQDIAEARAACGEAVFAAEWAQGYTMGLAQAIEYGLAGIDADIHPPRSTESPVLPVSAHGYPAGLTVREVEVLRLLTQGLTYAQIADQLIVSRRTVNAHVSSIYNKLGVNSRAEAARYAAKHQL